jgi:hypothetical protein
LYLTVAPKVNPSESKDVKFIKLAFAFCSLEFEDKPLVVPVPLTTSYKP